MEKEGKIIFTPGAKKDIDKLLDEDRISELKAMGHSLEELKESLDKGLPFPPNVHQGVLGCDEQLIRTMNDFSGREIRKASLRKEVDFPLGSFHMGDVYFSFLDAKATYRNEEISFDELTGCRFLSVGYENGYKIYLSPPKGTEKIVIEVRGFVFPPIPLQRRT